MSISRDPEGATGAAVAALAEYVTRAARLAPLFPTHVRSRPLPTDLLAYESPHNLALELSKSILYEDADKVSQSLRSEDALWANRPQQYFESMRYAEGEHDAQEEFHDSLAP